MYPDTKEVVLMARYSTFNCIPTLCLLPCTCQVLLAMTFQKKKMLLTGNNKPNITQNS